MSTGPIINAVTVVRNAERTIAATMDSVLAQDYPRLRYIVIDGDSSDGTVEIIAPQRQQLAYFSSVPDLGIYHAMNKAISVADGELIMFINAGDCLSGPTVLSEFIGGHYRAQQRVIWLFSVLMDSGELIEPVRIAYRRCYKLPVHHQGIIYPLAALKALPFPLRFPLVADFHNYYQLSRTIPSRAVPLLLSRFDTSGVTSTDTTRLNHEFVAAYADLGVNPLFSIYRRLRILLNR